MQTSQNLPQIHSSEGTHTCHQRSALERQWEKICQPSSYATRSQITYSISQSKSDSQPTLPPIPSWLIMVSFTLLNSIQSQNPKDSSRAMAPGRPCTRKFPLFLSARDSSRTSSRSTRRKLWLPPIQEFKIKIAVASYPDIAPQQPTPWDSLKMQRNNNDSCEDCRRWLVWLVLAWEADWRFWFWNDGMMGEIWCGCRPMRSADVLAVFNGSDVILWAFVRKLQRSGVFPALVENFQDLNGPSFWNSLPASIWSSCNFYPEQHCISTFWTF